MRDRHLDQILMCAIYVFGRNARFPTTFKDIMMSYRKQPLTTSNVYRDVHMTEADIAFERETTGGQAAAASAAAAAATTTASNNGTDSAAAAAATSGKKYDIISFYNFCYVRSMQEFVMSTKEDRLLSPLPSYGNPIQSPRKVSERHSLYIQPFEPRELPLSPNTMTYSFKASPVEVSTLFAKTIYICSLITCSVLKHRVTVASCPCQILSTAMASAFFPLMAAKTLAAYTKCLA